MEKTYQFLDIEINKPIYRKLSAIQYDNNSRYILVSVYSNFQPYDLTYATVKIYGIKKDKTVFFNNAKILDSVNGKFEIDLTEQCLACDGDVEIQIIILGANKERLSSNSFILNVKKNIIDPVKVTSQDEWGILTEGLANLAEYDVYKNNVERHDKEIKENKSILNTKVSKNELFINIEDFGANYLYSNEINKQALQDAIKFADKIGSGLVFVPPQICYGYNRNDINTHPNFDNILTRVIVFDCSRGVTYETNPEQRDGAQIRYFFNTEGLETDSHHDGNGQFFRGKWHPYLFISNDGSSNNRRATLFFGNKGLVNWGVGQGVNEKENGSDNELSSFKIIGNNIAGGEGLVVCYVIDKVSGMMGWNTANPSADFDFIGRKNGVMRLRHSRAQLRIENDISKFVIIPHATQPLIQFQNGDIGEIFNIHKEGEFIHIRRRTPGSVGIKLENNNRDVRTIEYRDETDEISITNKNNTSYVLSLTDNGDFKVKGFIFAEKGVASETYNSTNRPSNIPGGTMIFDTSLKKPIWYYDGKWYDASGATV